MEEVGVSMVFSLPFLLCCLLSLLGYGSEGFLPLEEVATGIEDDVVFFVSLLLDVDLIEVSMVLVKVDKDGFYHSPVQQLSVLLVEIDAGIEESGRRNGFQ